MPESVEDEIPPQTQPQPQQSPQTQPQPQQSYFSTLLIKLMSKRRTWVFLFVSVYAILLSLSWNLLKSVLSWYEATMCSSSSSPSTSDSKGWQAIYASVILGGAFGILWMVAALAVAVPATLVTWITILVLLTFCGKPRKALVLEGKKLTSEITRFVAKVLIKEGNAVAALCAVIGYFALVRKSKETAKIGSSGSDFDL